MLKFFRSIFDENRIFNNIKNACFYFFGSVVQTVLALFAQPVYSMHLSSDEFGIIGYFEAIKNIFSPLFIFSIATVYLMHYFKQSEEENKQMLFNLTFFLCCFNSVFVFLGYGLMYLYFKNLNITIPLNPFAWFILIALLLDNIKTIVLINYRIRKKAFSFFNFSAINSFLNVGIGLFLVAILKWGAEGRMLAPIISSVLMLPFCILILKEYTIFYLNFKFYLKAMKIAFPLVLASYAYVPIMNSDRLFLERLNNLSELGMYSIGITIAGYAQLAYSALQSAFEPDIFKSVEEKKYKKLWVSAFIMFVPYLIFLFIFCLFSERIISVLTAGRYIAAAKYTNIVLASVFLMGVFYFFDRLFIAFGKTRINLLINTIGGISAIFCTYFFVNAFQYLGAAYAKIMIAFIMVVFSVLITIKYLDFKTTQN